MDVFTVQGDQDNFTPALFSVDIEQALEGFFATFSFDPPEFKDVSGRTKSHILVMTITRNGTIKVFGVIFYLGKPLSSLTIYYADSVSK